MEQSKQPKFTDESKYLEQLQNFGEHMKSTVVELLDSFEAGKDYDEKFDIKIECNGKTLVIDLHADAYDRLMNLIETEMSEYIELKEIHND